MVITDCNITKRGRVSVYIDGEFWCAVEADAWAQARLAIKQQVTPEQLVELQQQSELMQAKRRALNLLSSRSYTADGLARRLREKVDDQAAAQAVERMQELGLVDDEDYALRCARDLYHLRGFAARRIRLELTKRGVPAQLCALALEQFDPDEDYARAAALLQTKLGPLRDEKDLRRAATLLERYGYTGEAARHALRAAKAALPDPPLAQGGYDAL